MCLICLTEQGNVYVFGIDEKPQATFVVCAVQKVVEGEERLQVRVL